jgi:zinc/manganese transport system ATP-binding protein
MLEVHNLTLGYERHPAVHHLQTRVQRGSLLAVVGPNGAGKSTLMKGIIGQLKPLEGEILLRDIKRDQMAYLPQQMKLDLAFPISVLDLIALGNWHRMGPFRRLKRHHAQAVRDAIEAVGLSGVEKRPVGALSGGQMQRALFARLMVQDAELILLDEPFTAIDSRTTTDLVALVRQWNRSGKTVVAVLHDLEQVRRFFPQTLLLSREQVAYGPTEQVLTAENLERANVLAREIGDHAPVCRRLPGAAT